MFRLITHVLAVTALFCLEGCGSGRPKLTVGSKGGANQTVVGEILAQHIEKRTGMDVQRRTNVGTTPVIHQGLLMADIDVYSENVGALVANILRERPTNDAQVMLERARGELERIARVQVIGPLGFENPFVMVIRAADARAKNVYTISEAEQVGKPGWDLVAPAEFLARDDGMLAFQREYTLPMNSVPVSRELTDAYRLLRDKHATMVAGKMTDGALASDEFVVLKDDKQAFPPAQIVVLTRADVIQRRSDLPSIILELKGKITVDAIRKMAHEHETRNRPVRDLVAEFLRAK